MNELAVFAFTIYRLVTLSNAEIMLVIYVWLYYISPPQLQLGSSGYIRIVLIVLIRTSVDSW
jgi:hypothetical protein